MTVQNEPTPGPARTRRKDDPQAEPSAHAGATAAAGKPAMPHERDEDAGMTGGVPSPQVQQGHRDLQRGVEDTSRAPEADQAYKQLKK